MTGLTTDGRSPRPHAGLRTCVGCRQRGERSALLRVVAAADGDNAGSLRLVPDERERRPGRGAWLHPTEECLSKALSRRAFARALRLRGAPDADEVIAVVEARRSTKDDTKKQEERRDDRRRG